MSRIVGRGRYATETYPEAPRPGGSAPVAPLEPILLELWVGVMTIPPATPNGSIEAPFLTLQDAFDFVTSLPVGANTKVTYFINSGPPPAFSTTPGAGHHNIIGLDERTTIGVLTITPTAEGELTVSVRNLAGSIFVDGTTGHVSLTITNDAAGVGGLQAADIALGQSGSWAGTVDLVWVNGFVQACGVPSARARFYDCQFPVQGAIGCLAIDTCANCDIDFHNTIQVADVPNGLGFVGCNFHNGPVQFDGPPGSVVLDPQSGLTFNTATLLTSGASTNLAADVGDVLTVVAPGLPRWMPAGGSLGYGLYAARPAPGSVGSRYVASDGATEWVDDGAAWKPLIAGRPGTQIPLLATFPTVYGATATFADAQGRIVATSPGTAGTTLNARTAPIPVGVWSRTLHCTLIQEEDTNESGAMIVLTDGTIFRTFGLQLGLGAFSIAVLDWTTVNGPRALVMSGTAAQQDGVWFRVTDDTVNTSYEVSSDGLSWALVLSEATGAFTELGIGVYDNSSMAAVFDSWQ